MDRKRIFFLFDLAPLSFWLRGFENVTKHKASYSYMWISKFEMLATWAAVHPSSSHCLGSGESGFAGVGSVQLPSSGAYVGLSWVQHKPGFGPLEMRRALGGVFLHVILFSLDKVWFDLTGNTTSSQVPKSYFKSRFKELCLTAFATGHYSNAAETSRW